MDHDSTGSLDEALRLWSLSEATKIADTATSNVYRVAQADGRLAALKILKPYGADEIVGVRVMRWWAGHGAVTILAVDRLMIMMEWLDGEPLGNLVREHGRDDEATAILCDVAGKLLAVRVATPDGLDPLERRFAPLLQGDPQTWPASHRPLAARAAALATELLRTTDAPVPLHGDLHHDNIVGSSRGWLAIDPKGVLGDRHYEVSNVFRNPYGADALALTPARVDGLADTFTARLGLDRKRTLQWAAAHCALSECWNRETGSESDFNLIMLPLLLEAVDRAG
jgi:streptomycin 6-kinase